MSGPCPFCPDQMPSERKLFENNHWYVTWSKWPVSDGHILIIPHAHYVQMFDDWMPLKEEWEALRQAVFIAESISWTKYGPIHDWNLGMNIGAAAGQTVEHLHWHLIPRIEGDVDDPRGGIRGVIPEKKTYPKS